MVDLDQFYEDYIKDKTADQLADEIYAMTGTSVTGGLAKQFNEATLGKDVKDDITKLTMLLRAYDDKVMQTGENTVEQIDKIFKTSPASVLSPSEYESGTSNGITYTWNADKTVCTVSGTASGESYNTLYRTIDNPFVVMAPGKKYKLRFHTTNASVRVAVLLYKKSDASFATFMTFYGNSDFTIPTSVNVGGTSVEIGHVQVRLYVPNGTALSGTETVSNITIVQIPDVLPSPINDITYTNDGSNQLISKVPYTLDHNRTFTWKADGTCEVVGSDNAYSSKVQLFTAGGVSTLPPGIEKGKRYLISYETTNPNVLFDIIVYRESDSNISAVYPFAKSGVFYVPEDATGMRMQLIALAGTTSTAEEPIVIKRLEIYGGDAVNALAETISKEPTKLRVMQYNAGMFNMGYKVPYGIPYTYRSVADTSGKNPHDEGWYERSGSSPNYIYTLSTDTTASAQKTYYECITVYYNAIINNYRKLLCEVQPDIVAIEEYPQYIDGAHTTTPKEALFDALGMNDHVLTSIERGVFGKLPILRKTNGTITANQTRYYTLTEFLLPNGQTLGFICTALWYEVNSAAVTERAAELPLLFDKMSAYDYAIIALDMNNGGDNRDDASQSAAEGASLLAIAKAAGWNFAHGDYYPWEATYDMLGRDPDDADYDLAWRPMIDNIMYKDNGNIRFKGFKVLPDIDGEGNRLLYSDHYPVYGDFEIL